MITLLNPGLVGLGVGVLAVPIAIHLWSRRPARVVPVGSTKLLAGARPSRARQIALTDLPLLALRLAILALAGLSVAGLGWLGGTRTPERLALIDPTGRDAARQADSLNTLGWTARWLMPGLPLVADLPDPAADGAAPIWSLMHDAADAFPSVDSVIVAAPLVAASLDGSRPSVPFNVRFLPATSAVQSPTDTLIACLAGPHAPQEAVQLRAAIDAVAAAAGRAGKLAIDSCPASATATLSLRDAGPQTDYTLLDGAEYDALSGAWLIDPVALRSTAIIDVLSTLLQVRDAERTVLPIAAPQALPVSGAAATEAVTSSWRLPLALLAMALFAAERLWAARRLPSPQEART